MPIVNRRNLINIFLLLSIAILITCMCLAFWQIQRWIASNKWVLHTHEVIQTTDKTLIDILQTELSLYDYALEKNQNILQKLAMQTASINKNFHQLRKLTADNPIQQQNLIQIAPLIAGHITTINHIMNISPSNTTEIHQLIRSPHVQEHNKIFLSLGKIKMVELQLLKERSNEFNNEAFRTFILLCISATIAISLILLSFGLNNYHLHQLEKSDREKWQIESRLKKIIDSSSELIAAVDTNYQLLAFNKAYDNKIYDLTKKHVNVGMDLKSFLNDFPFLADMANAWHRAIAAEEFSAIFPFDTYKSEPHFYEAAFNSIKDLSGNFVGAAHIMRDITERKKVDNLKNEFISTVSHELRTPLTSIKGSLSLLLSSPETQIDDKTKNLLTIAYNNCERLIGLINDLLDIEKIEYGNIDFHFNRLELDTLIKDVVLANQAYAEKFNVKIEIIAPLHKLVISGDHDRLMQVLTNLLSNAIKFSTANDIVNISLNKQQNFARITIEDHGQGIPEEFKANIFKKFSQADSSSVRKHGGSGLGLSISKSIVEHHGGRISYKSIVGIGSTFCIDLPILKQQRLKQKAAPRLPSQKQVLYIEDDNDLAEIVTNLLLDDAVVTQARDQNQARQLIALTKYDLIILDLALPDGNGLELLPELNKLNLPIIVFSALEVPKEYEKYTSMVLVKSKITNKRFLEVIRNVLANKKTATTS